MSKAGKMRSERGEEAARRNGQRQQPLDGADPAILALPYDLRGGGGMRELRSK
jgi:hypothetical protein